MPRSLATQTESHGDGIRANARTIQNHGDENHGDEMRHARTTVMR